MSYPTARKAAHGWCHDARASLGEGEKAMHMADWNLYVLLAVFWLVFVLWRASSR